MPPALPRGRRLGIRVRALLRWVEHRADGGVRGARRHEPRLDVHRRHSRARPEAHPTDSVDRRPAGARDRRARDRHSHLARKEGRKRMTTYTTATREEWLAARLELLDAEKELTRRSDELARQRQQLPWVRIDKEYRFE